MAEKRAEIGYFDSNGKLSENPPKNEIKNYDVVGSKKPFYEDADMLSLILGGGTGLLSYTMADQIFNDEKASSKKRGAFDRLLSKLIPIGIGATGAYLGHGLGGILKKSNDENKENGDKAEYFYYPEYDREKRPVARVVRDESGNIVNKEDWYKKVIERARKDGVKMHQAFQDQIRAEENKGIAGMAGGGALDAAAVAALIASRHQAGRAGEFARPHGGETQLRADLASSRADLQRVEGYLRSGMEPYTSGGGAVGAAPRTRPMTPESRQAWEATASRIQGDLTRQLDAIGNVEARAAAARRLGRGGWIGLLASAIPWAYGAWNSFVDADDYERAGNHMTEQGKEWIPGK